MQYCIKKGAVIGFGEVNRMDDYISRKSVTAGLDYIINELNKLITDDSPNDGYTDIKKQVEEIKRGVLNIQPAQPELIRCKDCKYSEHWYKDKTRCFLWHETGIDVFEDGYCNYAKRRTDADMRGEQDD